LAKHAEFDGPVMRMIAGALSTFAGLFALTVLLGPAGGVPFALDHGMSPLQTALIVGAINASLVPVLFALFEIIDYSRRYRDRVVSKILAFTLEKSRGFRIEAAKRVTEFERHVGQVGFGLGIMGFSFLFGNVWASAGAYLLNLKKATIIAAIAIGAVASSIFWTLAFVGAVSFLPSPWILYIVLTGVTFSLLIYKKVRERRLYRKLYQKISHVLREIGRRKRMGQLERYVKELKEKVEGEAHSSSSSS
jgi:uncharacterized membrane protein